MADDGKDYPVIKIGNVDDADFTVNRYHVENGSVVEDEIDASLSDDDIAAIGDEIESEMDDALSEWEQSGTVPTERTTDIEMGGDTAPDADSPTTTTADAGSDTDTDTDSTSDADEAAADDGGDDAGSEMEAALEAGREVVEAEQVTKSDWPTFAAGMRDAGYDDMSFLGDVWSQLREAGALAQPDDADGDSGGEPQGSDGQDGGADDAAAAQSETFADVAVSEGDAPPAPSASLPEMIKSATPVSASTLDRDIEPGDVVGYPLLRGPLAWAIVYPDETDTPPRDVADEYENSTWYVAENTLLGGPKDDADLSAYETDSDGWAPVDGNIDAVTAVPAAPSAHEWVIPQIEDMAAEADTGASGGGDISPNGLDFSGASVGEIIDDADVVHLAVNPGGEASDNAVDQFEALIKSGEIQTLNVSRSVNADQILASAGLTENDVPALVLQYDDEYLAREELIFGGGAGGASDAADDADADDDNGTDTGDGGGGDGDADLPDDRPTSAVDPATVDGANVGDDILLIDESQASAAVMEELAEEIQSFDVIAVPLESEVAGDIVTDFPDGVEVPEYVRVREGGFVLRDLEELIEKYD